MKRFVYCAVAAFAIATTTAQAGGLAPTIEVAPIEIVETAPSSAANIIVPIIFIALIALATSNSGSSEGNLPSDVQGQAR